MKENFKLNRGGKWPTSGNTGRLRIPRWRRRLTALVEIQNRLMAQSNERRWNRSSRSLAAQESDKADVRLSKSLAWILRHGALKEGFQFEQGGFLNVSDILQRPMFAGFTVSDVKRVVANDAKRRYALRQTASSDSRLQIRANQGHTVEVADLELTEITDPSTFECVVHGTYRRNLDSIRRQGLSRMARNHIHFASSETGSGEIRSGARADCDVFVYVDLARASSDGLKFYRSTNDVILCPGNESGIIPAKYFQRVVIR